MTLLHEHFEKMQAMCARYLEPVVYLDRDGCFHPTRDEAFISDMIYMLDGPEQRAAQGTEAGTGETQGGSTRRAMARSEGCAQEPQP